MDSAVIVDRSQGTPLSSARWKKLVPLGMSLLGGSRLSIPARCSADFQLAFKFSRSEMPLLRLNSQGENNEVEYDVEPRIVSENCNQADSSKLSMLKILQNTETISNLLSGSCTVSTLQRQSSLLHLASPFCDTPRHFQCMANAWSRNTKSLDSFAESSSSVSKLNEITSTFSSEVEPFFSNGYNPNSISTKLYIPSVTLCDVIDLNRQCSYSVEVPMSVTMTEKCQPSSCLRPLISNHVEPNSHIGMENKDRLKSVSTGSWVSLQSKAPDNTECVPTKLKLDEMVTIRCQQEKSDSRYICSGKVRFLCRRKNAFNVRREMSKGKQSKRIQPSHCGVVESKFTNEFMAIPVSKSHCKMNTWFVQPSDLLCSEDSGSSSSFPDEEDGVESSSSTDFKTFNKNIRSEKSHLSSSSESDTDDEDYIQFLSSAENDQEGEITLSDFQLESSLSTYASCGMNSALFEWSTKSSEDLLLSSKLLTCCEEEDEIDGVLMQSRSTLIEINSRWNRLYEFTTQIYPAETCPEKLKTVKFNSKTSSVEVLNEVEWAKDYEDARRGSWVQDRLHFDRRIRETEKQISWIFCAKHREKQAAIHCE